MHTFRLLIFAVNVLPIFSEDVKHGNNAEVDHLLEVVQKERKEDALCIDTMVKMLYGVKNSTLWASWMWDAMQRPTGTLYGSRYQLGNYDQCLNAPWKSSHPAFRTQYCLVDFKLANNPVEHSGPFDPYISTEYYVEATNLNNRSFNILTVGVCIPNSCGEHMTLHIASVVTGASQDQVSDVQCISNYDYDWKFYAFMGLITCLTVFALSSTYYLKSKEHSDEKNNSLVRIAECFCLTTNLNGLTAINKEEIRILNGMRFLTAFTAVFMHEIFFLITSTLSNGIELDEEIRNQLSYLLHIDVMIDTFFLMSGMLFVKGLLRNINQNLLLALLKRYVRLIGPYAVMTLYMVAVHKFVGNGPLWSRFSNTEIETCSKYWWLNLFMINSNTSTLCYSVTWYISADYQLAILATVIVYIYRRNARSGLVTFVLAFVLATLIPGVLTYWNEYPALAFEKLQNLSDLRSKEDLNQVYIKSYSRAGAYLIGMAFGYIMTSYKPHSHRNMISKTWSHIGCWIAIAILGAVISIGNLFTVRNYNPLEAAVSTAINRSIWAMAIICLIAISEYGNIRFIGNFLGWKIFVPLSRLSYGIYVIHPVVIQKMLFSTRNPLRFDYFRVIVDVVGITVLAVFLSLGMYLLVEAPLINVSNRYLSSRSKQQVNKKNTQNGYSSRKGHEEKSLQSDKNE